jgi:hypothetical protein
MLESSILFWSRLGVRDREPASGDTAFQCSEHDTATHHDIGRVRSGGSRPGGRVRSATHAQVRILATVDALMVAHTMAPNDPTRPGSSFARRPRPRPARATHYGCTIGVSRSAQRRHVICGVEYGWQADELRSPPDQLNVAMCGILRCRFAWECAICCKADVPPARTRHHVRMRARQTNRRRGRRP